MPTWAALSFQNSASPAMEQLISFHDLTMAILTSIITLVLTSMSLILTYKMTDIFLLQDQTVEIVWTVVPVFILLIIALPSLQTLYTLDDPFLPEMSIKTLAHQWYWSYEYSDFKSIEFDSYLIMTNSTNTLPRMMDTDTSLVIPSKTKVRVLTTSTDVIHAWTVPSMGLKADAVPGRLNQLMLSSTRPGLFFGQCSEICGINHSFMPIKLEVIPMNMFVNWVTSM
uniref:Cytochrome c oxidase subunit 2 n=1 Tax=Crangonyx forbesi TaxID=111557 RepID=A0A6C0X4X8_9CRUS|nr:cytochrome c oxidase subunit II [Crangonyx forbesi]